MPESLLPPPSEIHLWFVFCDGITDSSLLRRYRDMLSADERERERRFVMPRSRHRYLLTRALLRTTLSRYAAVSPSDWSFQTDRHGRPSIANRITEIASLSFNISHTEDLVLLGVTRACALGVDVESVRPRTPTLELAERYFSPLEARDLRAAPSQEQHERFFRYWTLKESYIKARGLGLSIPLDQFAFRIRGSKLTLQVEEQLGDRADRWRFWLLRPCADHTTAVCVERASGAQALVIREVVPLQSERPLSCEELGRSR